MMVLPKPLPSRIRRPDLFAGVLLALLFAAAAMPASAADGGPRIATSTAPRSRLHVEIPGYEEFYVPSDAPASVSAAVTPVREPPRSHVASHADTGAAQSLAPASEPVIEQAAEPAPVTAPLLAAAKAPISDATAGLVVGYTPGNVDVPATADPRLRALAERMRQEPTMIIALEGFAGGGDSLRARRLAMWRARAVRTRLIEDGIDTGRIRLRAAEAEAGAAATERVDVRIVQP